MSQSTEEARWMFFSLHWCGCRDVLPQTECSGSSPTHSARQPSPQAGRAPQLLGSLLTGMCMCLGRWTHHDLAAFSLCRWFPYHFLTALGYGAYAGVIHTVSSPGDLPLCFLLHCFFWIWSKINCNPAEGKLWETVIPLEMLFLISSFKISFSKGHYRGHARNNCRRGPINHVILVLIWALYCGFRNTLTGKTQL